MNAMTLLVLTATLLGAGILLVAAPAAAQPDLPVDCGPEHPIGWYDIPGTGIRGEIYTIRCEVDP